MYAAFVVLHNSAILLLWKAALLYPIFVPNQNINILRTYFLLMLPLLFLYSCSDLNEYTQYRTSLEHTAVLPASAVPQEEITIETPFIETQYETIYEKINSSADLVEEVKIETLTLRLESPSSGSFDFIKDLELYAQIEGEDPVKIGAAYDLDSNQSMEIHPEISDINFKDFFQKDKVKIVLSGTPIKQLTEDHHINAKLDLMINLKILGF